MLATKRLIGTFRLFSSVSTIPITKSHALRKKAVIPKIIVSSSETPDHYEIKAGNPI